MADPVGVVLVSHSAALAAGLGELLGELGGGSVPVALAGGRADGGLGTSFDLVERALAEADRGAGVVVLADLGSSVLTTRAALAGRTGAAVPAVLVDAPFVEGAVAAAVAASAGAALADVVAAAEQARDFRKF
ncbi:dihydroxyacetone kinase phosphoryl donor subunit DhaM [Kitasatospora sp. NPDC048365]|uniref:dihydroxyacetone kinase phosphoryl donor subunit DhaM n=1 Tax=Kitasatospora sp. NPDC048365 TaxID=3364050 RepID=UPI003718A55D